MRTKSIDCPILRHWLLFFVLFSPCGLTPVYAGEKYAVLVAIREYREPSWTTLGGPPNDLALWQDVLSAYGFEAIRIVVLENANATKAAICASIDDVASRAKPGDTVFIAFSGHATQIADIYRFEDLHVEPDDEVDGNDEALVAYDSRTGDPRTFIIDDELAFRTGRFVTGVQAIVVLDTCHAGGMNKGDNFDWSDVLSPADQSSAKGDPRGGSTILITATVGEQDKIRELLQLPTKPPLAYPVSPLSYALWGHAVHEVGLTYRRLVGAIGLDYSRWGLPWQPGLLAPTNLLDRPFLDASPRVEKSNRVRLIRWETNASIHADGRAFEFSREEVAANLGPLKLALSSPTGGGLVALVIGINEYPADSGLPPLRGAERDAIEVGKRLRSAGYEVTVMTADKGGLLVPTAGNVISQLRSLLSRSRIETLFIYFSGHGVTNKSGDPLLLTADARLADPDRGGIAFRQLVVEIQKSGAAVNHKIVLVDACKASASLVSSEVGFVEALQRTPGGWLFVTSCSRGQLARESQNAPIGTMAAEWRVPEAEGYLSDFTRGLVASHYRQSKANWSNGRIITIRDAFYAAKASLRPGADLWSRQVPEIFGALASEDQPFSALESIPEPPLKDKIDSSRIIDPSPLIDSSGSFWLYRNGGEGRVFPYQPYPWMWAGRVDHPRLVPEMMQISFVSPESQMGGDDTCVSFIGTWRGANADRKAWKVGWMGFGLVSGPNLPPWWALAGDNRGRYYNLQAAGLKNLIFSARSLLPLILTVKVGFLTRDSDDHPLVLGDSLVYPIRGDFQISNSWAEYQLPLHPIPVERHQCSDFRRSDGVCDRCGDNQINPKPNDLSRVCSVAILIEAPYVENPPPVHLFLDNVRFTR